jgi:hypothetical protein
MSMHRCIAAAGLACLALFAAASSWASSPPDHFTLRKDTQYEYGCFAPCDCPVMIREAVRGRFRLVPEGSDEGFRLYRVDDLRWVVHDSAQDLIVTGSGSYRLEEGTAPRHQLTLDLQVGSDPVRRFDSGLVSAPSQFPHVDARISVNGEYCWDYVFDVHARRARALGVDATAVTWEIDPVVSGHDVVVGSLDTLRRSGGDFSVSVLGCAARGTSSAGIPAGPDPPPGEGYWFLLRDVEGSIAGSYDSGEAAQAGWADAAIAASPLACP